MRWDGVTWLRDGVVTLRLDVAPVTPQGLRLTLTEGGPRPRASSVHELTVYEDEG